MPSQTLLFPLPELCLKEAYHFEPGLTLMPLSDVERRCLLDAVKRADQHSMEVLDLLHQSDAALCKECPVDDPVHSILYQLLAEWMGEELLDGLLLSDNYFGVRRLTLPSCGFLVSGEHPSLHWKEPAVLQRDWKPVAIEQQAALVGHKPHNTERAVQDLSLLWPRMRHICDIGAIENGLDLTNPDKRQHYIDAGNKRIADRAEQYVKETSEETQDETLEVRIPDGWAAQWFIQGYTDAFLDDKRKLEERLRNTRTNKRVQRAYRFFIDSSRVEQPNRFVNLMTCLESLLSTDKQQATYQLVSRVAWLLAPSRPRIDQLKMMLFEHAMSAPDGTALFDRITQCGSDEDLGQLFDEVMDSHAVQNHVLNQRMNLYEKLTQMYDLRSSVVHGSPFSWDELEKMHDELLEIVRPVFRVILNNHALFALFMDKDDGPLKAYLKKLPLVG